MEQVTDDIEAEIRNKETTEVHSKEIGELVMNKLEKLDKVAYIRFASVYRAFDDLQSFQTEVGKLMDKKMEKEVLR